VLYCINGLSTPAYIPRDSKICPFNIRIDVVRSVVDVFKGVSYHRSMEFELEDLNTLYQSV
jgi:hypothetical protein